MRYQAFMNSCLMQHDHALLLSPTRFSCKCRSEATLKFAEMWSFIVLCSILQFLFALMLTALRLEHDTLHGNNKHLAISKSLL